MKALNCLLIVFVTVFCWSLISQTGLAQESATQLADTATDLSDDVVEEVSEASAPEFVGADIAWMLSCSALVLMMTAPGLALFYGGLVRKKNILSVMMQCIFLMGLMSVVWALVGYSLAFGGDNPYFGNFDHVFLKGVNPMLVADQIPSVESALASAESSDDKAALGETLSNLKSRLAQDEYAVFTPGEGGSMPTSIFMCFQGMFFIITPALICGAFAERFRFSAMCVFMVLWGLLVYCPICHWVWSDAGWLCEWNENALFPALDFAGGTVVHISSGVSALVCAIFVGKRIGFGKDPMPPHNLTYTCIGTALLWVGWFGFNAGSALSAGTFAVNAFVATHLAAAAGVVSWAGYEWITRGKATVLGGCSGAVAGLVCITPACGSVSTMSAIILGLIAGVVCCWACSGMKKMFKYDDSLDAFGVHGVGGAVGAVLTGVFATRVITGGRSGMLESGEVGQLINQFVSIAASAGLAIVGTVLLLVIINATLGLRVSPEEEQRGLDVSQHGEEGYIFL
jgi:Amt family ammonium transporter